LKRILLFFCLFLLFGCQSNEKHMTLLDDVSSISISKSAGYGGFNEQYVITTDNKAFISVFEDVLTHAKGKKQKVNIKEEKPDYDLRIRYENGETHGLHLVLGNKGERSRIMYIGHENNSFELLAEDTAILRDLLEDEKVIQ